jgi:hypothetical protein
VHSLLEDGVAATATATATAPLRLARSQTVTREMIKEEAGMPGTEPFLRVASSPEH